MKHHYILSCGALGASYPDTVFLEKRIRVYGDSATDVGKWDGNPSCVGVRKAPEASLFETPILKMNQQAATK